MKNYSDDIGVGFVLDKCAKAAFKAGKLFQSSNITLNVNNTMRNLE